MSNLINLLDTYKGEKRKLYPLTPSQMGVYLRVCTTQKAQCTTFPAPMFLTVEVLIPTG